ncbi:LANO_0D10858g1_1 [Lachancea nothofagi CBS 11611]|uniref:LANO_0D10858g1_1 n=1 Tax=Lachancea nothofagi CBS 11611 TaxID=1266666 RepID=A0A1G4JKP5_9SACH|nr:LANO_0D10858g1_1 [Lachancea nothofagi CBS 11611]
MAPATPPRSRNRRAGKSVMLEPPRPEMFPMSPQRQPHLTAPVTPGSVGTKPNMSHFNRLRSPLHRSPARGLRTPEYTPMKPSESVRKKLDFGEETEDLQSVGRVLFPETSDANPQRSQNGFLAPGPASRLLQGAPGLLPPSSTSKAFSFILEDQVDDERPISNVDTIDWDSDSLLHARKVAKQTPSTPSDRIVTFELAKDWNNNSQSCFSSDEEVEETSITQKSLENPFVDSSVPSEETRRRRKELLIAEHPGIEDTIQYVDKNGKVVKERHLTAEEQQRFRPRKLFAEELARNSKD